MNRIQKLSETIEAERLKRRLGLSPDTNLDVLTLRTRWYALRRPGSPAGRRQPSSAGVSENRIR
jgi:hypothetical protein